MNRLLLVVCFLLAVAFTSCDKTNYENGYQEGYAKGYQEGQVKGKADGYDEGAQYGYGEGYAAGFAKSGKQAAVDSIVLSNLTSRSIRTFGSIVAWIFLILALGSILVLILSEERLAIIFAKIITVFIAIGLAYALMLSLDLNAVLFFKLEGVPAYLVYILLTVLSFGFAMFMYEEITTAHHYLMIFIIFLITFTTFYFSLFLSNIDTYILNNNFIIGATFSMVLGFLIAAIVELVDSQKTVNEDKKAPK